jgi:hypothetical protein
LAEDIVTAQLAPEPAQTPDQAGATGPPVGTTDKVTAVPAGKDALQVAEMQEMPLGLDVTVAGPLAVNVSVKVDGATPLKVTLALWFADIVTVHVAAVCELAQAPPQADTASPAPGAAVKVTAVLMGKDPLQVPALQEMPLGLDVTVPAPLALNVSVYLVKGADPARSRIWSIPVPLAAKGWVRRLPVIADVSIPKRTNCDFTDSSAACNCATVRDTAAGLAKKAVGVVPIASSAERRISSVSGVTLTTPPAAA